MAVPAVRSERLSGPTEADGEFATDYKRCRQSYSIRIGQTGPSVRDGLAAAVGSPAPTILWLTETFPLNWIGREGRHHA
jgi:hypothetical protein